MTYTVLGHCRESGQIGIGITTASIAVGGLCPVSTLNGDIVTSQAFARPELGLSAARALADDTPFEAIEKQLAQEDPNLDFRQIGMLRRSGALRAFTGQRCRPWAGHLYADDCVVMGNFLAGEAVVGAMAAAFVASRNQPLTERLLRTLEAGRDAGGQADAAGRPCRERSAALRVVGTRPGDAANYDDPAVAPVDLRVDLHEQALDELRRIWTLCQPVPGYNALRSADPQDTPALGQWEAEHMSPPPPSVYRDGLA